MCKDSSLCLSVIPVGLVLQIKKVAFTGEYGDANMLCEAGAHIERPMERSQS